MSEELTRLVMERLPAAPAVEVDNPHWDMAFAASREMPRRLCLQYHVKTGTLSVLVGGFGVGSKFMARASSYLRQCTLYRGWNSTNYMTLQVGNEACFDLLEYEMNLIREKFEPLGMRYHQLKDPSESTAVPATTALGAK